MESGFEWTALVTGCGVLVALAVGSFTIWQKTRSDNRAEWWRRVQWAMHQVNSGSPADRENGLITLRHLVRSKLADDSDLRLIRELATNVCRRTRP